MDPMGRKNMKLSDGSHSVLVICGCAPGRDQATSAQPPLPPLQGQSCRASPQPSHTESRDLWVQIWRSQGSLHCVRCRLGNHFSLLVPLTMGTLPVAGAPEKNKDPWCRQWSQLQLSPGSCLFRPMKSELLLTQFYQMSVS